MTIDDESGIRDLRQAGDVEGLAAALATDPIRRKASLRMEIAEALATIADDRSAALLVGLVDDPSERVRLAAIESLGRMRSEAALGALAGALRRDASNARCLAVRALATMGTREALDLLLAHAWAERDQGVQIFLIEAIAGLRSEQGLPWLQRNLQAASREIRVESAVALARLDRPQAMRAAQEFRASAGILDRLLLAYRLRGEDLALPPQSP